MLGVHLFLCNFGLLGRLSKEHLLAALLGALVHDYNRARFRLAFTHARLCAVSACCSALAKTSWAAAMLASAKTAAQSKPPAVRFQSQRFPLLSGADPGTNNAHEAKLHSQLAILHSDSSVLEHHHLYALHHAQEV